MNISGYLLPFPDPGAADLMSDHLEQVIQTTVPGKVVVRASLPETLPVDSPEKLNQGSAITSGSGASFARKKLEIFRLDGNDWVLLGGTTSDSDLELEEVAWEVHSAQTLKCKLTNMSGREGQFSLRCTFEPRDVQ